MKSKEPGTIRQLFAFVGENNGKMLLSIFLAVLGELFGIGPFLMVAVLADALYRGTATPKLVLFLCGGAAVCQIIKMLLTWRSSLMSHKISFTILKNIREAITGRMAKIPMGVMLETPTGAFKNLIVDNVAKLEDSMAHFMPELPSNIAAPLCSILLIFLLDWRMGLAALVTIPLGTLFFAAMMRGYGPRMENYMRSANEMNSALVSTAFRSLRRSTGPQLPMESMLILSAISTIPPWHGGASAGFGTRRPGRSSLLRFWGPFQWERGSTWREVFPSMSFWWPWWCLWGSLRL